MTAGGVAMGTSFSSLNPIVQALIATGFSWFMTAVGSGLVFFFKTINKRVLDTMLGSAAGVMIAASFWSLLAPSIEMSEELGLPIWIPPLVGFLAGGLFLKLADSLLPHLHIGMPRDKAEGIKSGWKRAVLLVLAITLHNIPEGLAVGVAIGAASNNLGSATLSSALILALGMGLQNLPEGAAVSIPLRREGVSRFKSFWYGQISGLVEPIAGVLGVIAVMAIKPILPYALAFAAGAMIYVVVEELLPEAQSSDSSDYSTIGCILGFALMMVLDITLG
jgi:ZIP family zinc transporter